MSNLTLSAETRTRKKSLEAKNIPAVVYGRGIDATAIAVNARDFNNLFEEAGEATIFTLDVAGEPHDVLVHDFQRHPVSYEISHVDFYAIEKGQKITVAIPIEFIGESPVEDDNGQVVKVQHEIEVTCEPRNLPSHIDVDLSVLVKVGDQIHVSDLKFGPDVEPTLDPEEIVVTTSEAKEIVEEDDSDTEEVDFSEIDVEGEKPATDEEPTEE